MGRKIKGRKKPRHQKRDDAESEKSSLADNFCEPKPNTGHFLWPYPSDAIKNSKVKIKRAARVFRKTFNFSFCILNFSFDRWIKIFVAPRLDPFHDRGHRLPRIFGVIGIVPWRVDPRQVGRPVIA